jgi:hypothetical protein
VGIQAAAIFAAGVALVVGAGCVWASEPVPTNSAPLAVPSFSASSAGSSTPSPAPRSTLLPIDCADLLAGQPDMAALLGRPIGSVGVHSVVGVAAPSVGQLERLTCNYQQGATVTGLALTLGAFADPSSAAAQRDRNIAAERADTLASAAAPLGDARATVLTEAARRMLLLAYDRYTLTETLAPGVVPDDQQTPMLTDLAQRVLPVLPVSDTRR